MYERTLNQSTTSLVSNTSISSRLVRKRDSNFSLIVRSRSKNKQDQGNSSFQHYLSKQSKLFSVDNEESKTQVLNNQDIKGKTNIEIKNQKMGYGNTNLTISQTLSTIQLNKNSLIQRGDRYIQPRMNIQINNGESKNLKKSQQNNARKRVPTPVKSKKQLTNQSKKQLQKTQNIEITQFQLRISGLQDALSLQKLLSQRKQKKLKQTLLDLQNVKQILSQVQMQNKILQNQKKICEYKISQLQKTILQSQNNLTLAQNNLNKLRQTIKQNRLAQLQTQYKILQRQNTIYKQQLQKNNQTISVLSDKLKFATKQIQQLRKYGSIQSFANKQSLKQQYLQKQLQRIKNQYMQYRKLNQSQTQKLLQERFKQQQKVINELKEQIAAMLVKINCLEFLKNKQIQQIKQNYQSQIKSLKVKYSKMIVQLKNKKGPNKLTTPLTSPHIKKIYSNSPTNPKINSQGIPCQCYSPQNSSIKTIQTQKLIAQQNIPYQFNPLTPNYLNTSIYGSNYNYVANNNININITNNNGQIRIQRNNEQYRNSQDLHYYPYANGSEYRPSSINCRIHSQVNRNQDCLFQLSPQ